MKLFKVRPNSNKGGHWRLVSIAKIGSSLIPWMIIGGLLWAGLFVKPAPIGATVKPPVMERRDYYYGIANVPDRGIWLAGSSGKIVELSDSSHIERLDSGIGQTIQDIAFWSEDRAVAVANEGVVVITSDGGKHWRQVTDVPKSQVANKLNRVRIKSGGIAIATGEMGALLLSKDYGESWARIRSEEDQAWNDAAVQMDGKKIIAIGEFGKIVQSTDGGGHWINVESPVKTSLTSISFSNEKNAVAVGLEGVVLVTHDGGNNWNRLDIKVSDHLFDIAWDEETKRWIGCGGLGRWVVISEDGRNWETGRLDERDLSWHVRVLPVGKVVWFSGANVGRWDGSHWQPLGDGWQPPALLNLQLKQVKLK